MSGRSTDTGFWLVRRDGNGDLVAAELPSGGGTFVAVPEDESAWQPFDAAGKPAKKAKEEG